ncbi:MAG: polymer-forming cytoskeletal protein [Acidobacteria bacterium]|nr:polymer-forming cytoskeletal protein [Acidobacteriota bacterium]MCL5287346.1 polymer-forming cytoskeletal protein [Acidobacteriota bacterium]
MWRRTSETKPPLPSPEPPAAPPPVAFERTAPVAPAEPLTVKTMLGRGVALKGELEGREDVCIDGEFEGTIRVLGAGVTIGANGRVTAEVEADEIFVEGHVEGSLRARQRMVIRRTGHVTGDIEAPRLAIEDGAVLCGHVEMAQPGARAAQSSAVPRTEREAYRPVPMVAGEAAR